MENENKAYPETNETIFKLNGTLMNTNKTLERIAVALEKLNK